MSLLGIDIGTTGCKVALFSEEGEVMAHAYEEYDIQRPRPGWAQLDAVDVWKRTKATIKRVADQSAASPPKALSVSSLGEAMVPVTRDRRILGPSILCMDIRGEEYLDPLSDVLERKYLYRLTGNTLGNHYGLTKLMWLKEHQPEIYEQADKCLLWGSFITFMLGAEPAVDFSLANRTMLFDIEQKTWTDVMIDIAGIDSSKLPKTVPSGCALGTVSKSLADELGLPPDVMIVAGAHDQCANAVGCGVVTEGQAAYGMGTFICITPVFNQRPEPERMMARGLNTEDHAVPGRYVTFIYNQGGSLVKWFRDLVSTMESRTSEKEDHRDIYAELMSEVSTEPGRIMVLPHFEPTGPPEFISNSSGVIMGLQLDTSRGDILKGIMEGTTFFLKESIESLQATDMDITEFRAVGGGSKSDAWVQTCADIMGKPFVRPKITEAGVLGAAIIAGTGTGLFASCEEGIDAMVSLDVTFDPNPERQEVYSARFDKYSRLWPLMKDYLTDSA